MHRLRSAVYFNLNGLHVGFPHLVGSSMRMTHVITEMNTFFTDIALCHFAAPPLNPIRPQLTATQNIHIIPDPAEKSKENFQKYKKIRQRDLFFYVTIVYRDRRDSYYLEDWEKWPAPDESVQAGEPVL